MKTRCRSCPLSLICMSRGKSGDNVYAYFRCKSCHKTYLDFGHTMYSEIEVQVKIPECSAVAKGFYSHCDGCIRKGR